MATRSFSHDQQRCLEIFEPEKLRQAGPAWTAFGPEMFGLSDGGCQLFTAPPGVNFLLTAPARG